MSRENFYILLGLDPSVEDPKVIEATIMAKSAEWSKDRNHPTDGNKFSQYLGWVPQMRKILINDPALRKTEADEARQLHRQKQKEAYEEIDRAVKVIASKGHIFQSEFNKLVAQYKLPEAEVRSRVKVPIKPDPAGSAVPDDGIKPIESSVFRAIEADLKVLGKKDLYGFLGVTSNSSLTTLTTKTDEIDNETKNKADKGAVFTATRSLIGHCKTIFKSEDSRKGYEKAAQLASLQTLLPLLHLAGEDGVIDAHEYEELVTAGMEKGNKKEAVEAFLKNEISKKKWSLTVHADSSLDQLSGCGVCGTLNKTSAQFCSNCAAPLKIACPQCGKENPNSNRGCFNCGFAIGDMLNALPLIRQAQEALAVGALGDAERLLNQAAMFWKNKPEIETLRSEIRKRRGEQDTQIAEIQALTQKNQFYAAHNLLLKATPDILNDGRVAAYRAQIEKNIAAAESLLARAKTSASSAEQEELLLQCLSLCRDCQAAEQMLAHLPPEPPEKLTAQLDNNVVTLRWMPVRSRDALQYRVLRRQGAAPTHPSDGESLGDTAQTFFQDSGGQTGQTYFYGIFTLRRGALSAKCAISEALTKIANVENVAVQPGNGRIALQWKSPENARRIEVWAKKGQPPARRGDGDMLAGVRFDGVVHESLANEQVYGYLIVAVFQDMYGKEVFAPGVPASGAATMPPQAVAGLKLYPNGEMLEIQWPTVPGKAEHIEIFFSEQPFQNFSGEHLRADFSSKNQTAKVPVSQPGKATFRFPHHGLFYFLPVSVKGNLYIAGQQEKAAHLAKVTGLSGTVSDEGLRLEWKFPAGAQKALVSWKESIGSFAPARKEVTEAEYQRERGCILRNIPADWREVKIAVQTMLDTADGALLSAEESLTVRVKKTAIRFSVQKKTSLFSSTHKFKISVQADSYVPVPIVVALKENNKLISSKDPDRVDVLEISPNLYGPDNSYSGDVEYRPSGGKVKSLFFTLLPKDLEYKDHFSIEDNGKKIDV
jgi:hypothetical protein